MSVVPIPGEPERFYVSSQSRAGLLHTVDVNYEERQDRPRAGHYACGCEQYQCKGKVCAHIRATMRALKQP